MTTEEPAAAEWDEALGHPAEHLALLNRRLKATETDLTAAEDARNDALESCRVLSMALAGEGLDTMRATKKADALRLANGILRTARADVERERDDAKRRLAVMEDAYTAAQKQSAARYEELTEANRLLNLAMHLRQHGENAPGGTETWAQFDREAETYLRWGAPDRRKDKPL